ncbi:hypothetical protein Bhyg_15248, partial [Pseudolycoriella hygida]
FKTQGLPERPVREFHNITKNNSIDLWNGVSNIARNCNVIINENYLIANSSTSCIIRLANCDFSDCKSFPFTESKKFEIV